MRAIVLALSAVLVVAACGRVAEAPLPASGKYKVYEAATNSIAVIDSRSHEVERGLPLGTPSPDWKHLYSIRSDTLFDVDPRSGAIRHTLQLPSSSFDLPRATFSGVPGGLSQNGRWLVVETLDQTSGASNLLVVDTSFAKQPDAINLAGSYQFDAISNDGQSLYLIEHISSAIYKVRVYDVRQNYLNPNVVFDKSEGTDAMAGLRLSGVASPDGHWLYSLYVREHGSAFIHALSLDNAIAFCIDLPGKGYADMDAFRWSLALSADGSHLYAANGAIGVVSEIDLNSYAVKRTVKIGAPSTTAGIFAQDVDAKEFGGNAAVLSPDGQTLVMAGDTGVVWADTATLHARSRQLSGWTVWSLALSPDGSVLYAVNDAGMIAELSMAGPSLATTFAGSRSPLALLRVEPVVQSP